MPTTNRPGSKPTASHPTSVTLRIPSVGSVCERARRLAGRTLDAAEAPKLPLQDCARIDCRCRYEPLSERRRKTQREESDRRDLIRFETKEPRRKTPDRRKRNTTWDKS